MGRSGHRSPHGMAACGQRARDRRPRALCRTGCHRCLPGLGNQEVNDAVGAASRDMGIGQSNFNRTGGIELPRRATQHPAPSGIRECETARNFNRESRRTFFRRRSSFQDGNEPHPVPRETPSRPPWRSTGRRSGKRLGSGSRACACWGGRRVAHSRRRFGIVRFAAPPSRPAATGPRLVSTRLSRASTPGKKPGPAAVSLQAGRDDAPRSCSPPTPIRRCSRGGPRGRSA